MKWILCVVGSVLTLEWVRRKQQLLSSKSFRTASWAAGQCLTHINACRFLTCFNVKRCACNIKCFCLFQEQNIWHDPVLSEPDPLLKARETWVCVCVSLTLLMLNCTAVSVWCVCALYTPEMCLHGFLRTDISTYETFSAHVTLSAAWWVQL